MAPCLPFSKLPSQDDARETFIGKDIGSLPKPAAILDVAKARRHCKDMLDGIERLGVDFRAHVKTHKVSWTSINDHLVRAT
jgi:D-serine deaminase-like pyridoxal phosphate-dependent protein